MKHMEPDHDHFQSIPWCSQILNDPDFVITPTFSRQPKQNTEDSLIAETLQSNNTISACLSVYRRPPPGTPWISEVRSLMTLGTGMNGGPHMLHGGLIATLLDDTIGTLLTINKDQDGNPLTAYTVTVCLNIRYLRPVKTPQTVLVVAKCKEIRGTKFYMDAEIRDGRGNVLASADSIWTPFKKRAIERL
jgi:acyl-coenzyme A thioesterase PaaI-like protein